MLNSIPIPFWEGWIIIYFFVGGLGGAAYFVACLLDLLSNDSNRPITRAGWALGFPAAIASALCLVFDLGVPSRFLHMIFNIKNTIPGTLIPLPDPKIYSPISMGTYILLGFGIFTFVHFLRLLADGGTVRGWLARIAHTLTSGGLGVIVGALGGLFGLLLAGYTAVLITTTQFPAWRDNPFMGMLFVASAMSTGTAAIALMLVLRGKDLGEGWHRLKILDNFAIILELAAIALLFVALGNSAAPYLKPMNAVLLFGGVVGLGLLVPLIMQWRPAFSGAPSTTALTMTAALLVLMGGLILRTIIVLAPQGLM